MADFTPVDIGRAREFLRQHHWGILATRRKNGTLQMSPVSPSVVARILMTQNRSVTCGTLATSSDVSLFTVIL